jgi:hypothetical protein
LRVTVWAGVGTVLATSAFRLTQFIHGYSKDQDRLFQDGLHETNVPQDSSASGQ